ncbi:MAG TPA: glycosyltransferase [Candidatus Krumholzibacteria bacterium]|nr:glycosyltransferase [Candidatus Krumholzibacteria bacterium]
MTTRRILVVSYHALPRVTPGSLRVAWMSEQLAARGWDVRIVTSVANPTVPPGVRVISTARAAASNPAPRATRLRTLWNDLAIPDRFVGWTPALTAALSDALNQESVDVVLSTSPPHSTHLALAWVRRSRRFRWIADFRDPWTAPTRYPRAAAVESIQRWLEGTVVHACNEIIANTPGNRAALLRAFPRLREAAVHVLPNGFDDGMLERAAEPALDDADITYVGEIYPGMVDRFAAALRMLAATAPGVAPSLSLYGEVDPREWKKLEAAGLAACVRRHGKVSHEESLRVMRRARSLLLLLPDRPSWATCVPSKLYPYLASGRPVLALVPDGDAARIVRDTGAGEALTDPDPAATARGIESFLRAAHAPEAARGRRDDAIHGYAVSSLADRLDAILSALAERPQ